MTKRHLAIAMLWFGVVGMVASVATFLFAPELWETVATLVILLLSWLALVYAAVGDLWLAKQDED